MQFDPRTIARDISGIFDVVFPQLTPGVVAHFNRAFSFVEIQAVDPTVINDSALRPAMLAEIAYAIGEVRLLGESDNFNDAVEVAVARQRKHYDAQLPDRIEIQDRVAVESMAVNFVEMISLIREDIRGDLRLAPHVAGYQWIASGVGDVELGDVLIEVKFGARSFSSSDYRQVVIYWLLDYMSSIEKQSSSWSEFVLLNPKRGKSVRVKFDEFLDVIGGGRSKIELVQAFANIVRSRSER